MIQVFRDKDTQRIWETGLSTRVPATILRRARRKLAILDAATAVIDIASPPGNRLEPLKGDGSGQHSIRVNVQWRLCFTWTPHGPTNVEFVDYH